MAKVLPKLGRIKCHCCGSLVILKKQANGLPIYTCNECDCKLQAFSADSGRRLMAQCVERFADNEPANDERQQPAPQHGTKAAETVPPKKSLGAAFSDALGF